MDVLSGINSDCIDLIYLDPPFNKNKEFTAPIGTSAEGASFKDIFREEDLKEEWLQTLQENNPDLFHYLNGIRGVGKPYNFAYLAYMAIRLLECCRVLKSTGSIYLHCDPTMSHYLKSTMDCIFGEDNFRNEVVWRRTNAHPLSIRKFEAITDAILFYTKTDEFKFYGDFTPMTEEQVISLYNMQDGRGRFASTDLSGGKAGSPEAYQPFKSKLPPTGRAWAPPALDKLTSWAQKELGESYSELTPLEKCHALDDIGLIYWTRNNTPRFKRYLEGTATQLVPNVWTDILPASGNEKIGYPTQKPRALLERIIKASSNERDIVLDPFCGCATTCIAAENLNRQWIGIDVSIKAFEFVQKRLTKEVADPGDILKYQNVIHLKTDPPKRTDQAGDYKEQKFVYVISHPNFPCEYKVGIAKDWKSRLNSYQTSDPERQYKLEFKIETPWFRETEQHIHDIFSNKHEWVQGNLEEIIEAIKQHKPIHTVQDTL